MTASDTEYDVLIVGFGPVGQVLAALLGQQGRRVGVVEQFTQPYHLPRAGHFDGEVMRVLQAIGVAEEVELLARPVFIYDLVDARGEQLHRVEFGQSGTGWKTDYLFYQPELEAVLARRVAQLDSVDVHRGVTATSLVDDGTRVHLEARTGDGPDSGRVRFSARYLVGADGNAGFVRTAAGLVYTDLGFTPLQYLVCDFENADPSDNLRGHGEVRQTLDPARPHLFGRWNGNRWSRWEFMVLPGEDPAELEQPGRVWELVAPWGVTPDDGHFVRTKVYTFDARIVEQPRRGRVLLAGDAFHLMPPFMGQGMCSGIRDAMNVSWKLDAVLGGASDDLLDSYTAERVTHATAITRMSMGLAEACTLLDPELAAARDARYRSGSVAGEGLPALTVGLLDHDDTGAVRAPAGQLAPQGRVHRDGRTALLDDHIGLGWRLLTRGPLPRGGLSAEHAELLERLGVTVVQVTFGVTEGAYLDVDGAYERWFDTHDATFLVERPDFYVFGAARDATDLPRLLDSLGAVAGHALPAGPS